jgi:hypothetical protein
MSDGGGKSPNLCHISENIPPSKVGSTSISDAPSSPLIFSLKQPPWLLRLCYLWHNVMEHPTPPILTAKYFIFAFCGLLFYHMHHEDRCQNQFVLAGIASALSAALILPVDMGTYIQTWLPIYMLIALCLSAVLHRIPSFRERTSLETRARGMKKNLVTFNNRFVNKRPRS